LGSGGDAVAFGDGVDGVGGNVRRVSRLPLGQRISPLSMSESAAEAEVQARVAGGEVAGAGFDFFSLRAGGGCDSDASAANTAASAGRRSSSA